MWLCRQCALGTQRPLLSIRGGDRKQGEKGKQTEWALRNGSRWQEEGGGVFVLEAVVSGIRVSPLPVLFLILAKRASQKRGGQGVGSKRGVRGNKSNASHWPLFYSLKKGAEEFWGVRESQKPTKTGEQNRKKDTQVHGKMSAESPLRA